MFDHWRIVPPAEVLIAWALKYEPPRPKGAEAGWGRTKISPEEQRRQAEELIAMFGGGVVR